MKYIDKMLAVIVVLLIILFGLTLLDMSLKAQDNCIQYGYEENGVFVPACRINPDCL